MVNQHEWAKTYSWTLYVTKTQQFCINSHLNLLFSQMKLVKRLCNENTVWTLIKVPLHKRNAQKNLNLYLSKNQLAYSWIITAYQNNTLKVTSFSIVITCCWYNNKLSSMPEIMTTLSHQKWQPRLTVFSNFFSVWGPQNVNCFGGLIF